MIHNCIFIFCLVKTWARTALSRCIISVTQGELFAVSKYVKVTVILSSQSENTHANWLNIKYKLSKIV